MNTATPVPNHQKIIELNTIWYNLITSEYHKDRDCHFYIYTHYFYGDDAQYTVEHKGYINHRYEDTHWDTYEEAEKELIRLLREMIIEEIDWYLSIPEPQTMGCEDKHARFDDNQLEDMKKKVLEIAPA